MAIIITKANGQQEEFDQTKLEDSLKRAGANANMVSEILETITAELEEGMSTKEIYHNAFDLLKKHDTPIAANYSIRRAVMELGPSGFPFEKLIAEIFKEKGYETETGRKIQGGCTEHEIDVLAFNEKELHLVEAKFHNSHGVKTDTKVALYVKARYEDLKDSEIMVGEEKRKMTEGWLITNTKFTRGAIQYAECQLLKLVGWNYPQKDNLQDMIIETNLHPITILSLLSKTQKQILLEKDVILLKQIKQNPELLNMVGLSEEKKQKVLDEVHLVCVNH